MSSEVNSSIQLFIALPVALRIALLALYSSSLTKLSASVSIEVKAVDAAIGVHSEVAMVSATLNDALAAAFTIISAMFISADATNIVISDVGEMHFANALIISHFLVVESEHFDRIIC